MKYSYSSMQRTFEYFFLEKLWLISAKVVLFHLSRCGHLQDDSTPYLLLDWGFPKSSRTYKISLGFRMICCFCSDFYCTVAKSGPKIYWKPAVQFSRFTIKSSLFVRNCPWLYLHPVHFNTIRIMMKDVEFHSEAGEIQ